MIRNIIKIQIFLRAILKMRNDAAFKIQRKRRMLKTINFQRAEIEQKVDQL